MILFVSIEPVTSAAYAGEMIDPESARSANTEYKRIVRKKNE